MATHLPELKCALCGEPIDPFGSFFRATGEFLPPKDSLVPFCNMPLHWYCYAQWPERRRFAGLYVQAWAEANRRNPFWWRVLEDEAVYVSVNPERPIEEASIRLCEVGSDIRVPLPKWSLWVTSPEVVTPGLQPLEREALQKVLPFLRERFPNDHAVVDAIDPDEKRPGGLRRRGP